VIWNVTRSEVLKGGTLALVDTDPKTLGTMMKLAQKVADAVGAPTKIIGSTDRREVMEGSDFVILAFSKENARYRGIDCEVALKHGIRMCSGDTIGPGGIFRALREIPTTLAVAEDCARLAPDAWLISFVNPTSVLGIALMRHAKVRNFSICDSLHEPHFRLRQLKEAGILAENAVGIPPEVSQKLDLRVAGVNHFTWMLRFAYEGRDMLPVMKKRLQEGMLRERQTIEAAARGEKGLGEHAHSKGRYNRAYSHILMDAFGPFPVCMGHTKEYVRYFQGIGILPDLPEPIHVFDSEGRGKSMQTHMRENEEYAEGKRPIEEFLSKGAGDHATDIVESMWGGLGKCFFVNTANRGAVSNMAADAFLELRSDLDLSGPRPQPVGDMPRGLLALQQQILDTHELTAEAAMSCDRGILLRAFLMDPLTRNIPDSAAIIDELLRLERAELDPRWFNRPQMAVGPFQTESRMEVHT
jgi:alpha-galactosidase